MLAMNVDQGKIHVILCIFENKLVKFFEMRDFKLLHTLSLAEKYKLKEKRET